ncbi:prominin-1-like isoform X2 [Lineus longissimus]|uniref:prominin-1-like isoform X2 n=1 Tax=Lineus longissimus TaxID=88925 RepID=UPI002B4F6AD2
MEHFYPLVFILTFIAVAYGGTVTPAIVEDQKGNVADSSSNITWGPLPQGKPYASNDPVDYGGLAPLYKMMKTFLDVVQPNEFPYDMIAKVIGGDMSALNDPMSLVMYGIGFGICFAIGILFVIIMPIVGCCFCCCRLCGNCGGKKIHKPENISNCHRIAFTVLGFVMATFIMIPAACSLVANNQTTKTLNNVGTVAVNNINDLETFLGNVILEVNHASLTNYNFTASVLKRDLDNIGVILGEKLRDEMIKKFKIDVMFQKIIALDTSMQKLNGAFNSAATQQTAFKTASDDLKAKLDTERGKVVATQGVTGCSGVVSCNTYPTATLDIDSNPALIPNIDTTDINAAASKNLTDEFEKSTKSFYDIPTTIQTDTATVRADAIQKIDSFYSTINNAMKQVSGLTNNLGVLTDAKKMITEYTGQIGPYDKYRWYGGIGLGCLLIMIAGFQYIGCIIGAVTYRPKVDPTERSCCNQTGANFLMASVGFAFIFSWLLMLLTSLTFIVGGNLQKLMCEPLLDPNFKIFKTLIDKPNGILGDGYFLSGMILGDNKINLTISGVLSDCKNHKSAWKALKLNNLIDLSSATDYKSQFNIEDDLKNNNNIDLSGVTTVTGDLMTTLDKLKQSLNADFTLMIAELSKDSVKTPLTPYADGLISEAGKAGVTGTTAEGELRAEAATIKALDGTEVQTTDTARVAFNASLTTIQTDKLQVQLDIDAVNTSLIDLQSYLQNNASTLVTTEVVVYAQRLLGILESFVNETLSAVENKVGICTPLWNFYDSIVGTLVCGSIVDTVNGLWFCLGWATIFFIPSIIISVKLYKYLRVCRPIDPDLDKKGKKGKKNRVAPQERY